MEHIGDYLKNVKVFKPFTRSQLISQFYVRLSSEALQDCKDFPQGKKGWMMIARQLKTTPTWRLATLVKYEGKLSPLYWKVVKEAPKPPKKITTKKLF